MEQQIRQPKGQTESELSEQRPESSLLLKLVVTHRLNTSLQCLLVGRALRLVPEEGVHGTDTGCSTPVRNFSCRWRRYERQDSGSARLQMQHVSAFPPTIINDFCELMNLALLSARIFQAAGRAV